MKKLKNPSHNIALVIYDLEKVVQIVRDISVMAGLSASGLKTQQEVIQK